MINIKVNFVIILVITSFLMFSCNKSEKEKKFLTENIIENEITKTKPKTTNTENKNIGGSKKVIPQQTKNKSINHQTEPTKKIEEIKVTFIELGSVRCIPCKMMQPIMQEIEKEYGNQVKVIFYDVWTEEGMPYAEKYRIRVIPTQVFLDKDGNEYYRHEGFFPKEELVKILKMKGVE
jgi:thioredoxin 1